MKNILPYLLIILFKIWIIFVKNIFVKKNLFVKFYCKIDCQNQFFIFKTTILYKKLKKH